MTYTDWPGILTLVGVGAIASGINSVAGGGSLISFPTLTLGFHIPSLPANATNAVGLWPGSLSGAWGFRDVLAKTKSHLKTLWIPTLLGSLAGAQLLVVTDKKVFDFVVPWLLFLATALLWFQPNIKKFALKRGHTISPAGAIVLQTLVALYGGYFGAGMGIMMLAVFALYMDGNIHEINAVKTILGVVINLVASLRFLADKIVVIEPAIALTVGSLIGGYYAARWSQKVDPERLRKLIALFGICMSAYFAYRSYKI